jgi:nucleotide-binding universal stress UspA family protein
VSVIQNILVALDDRDASMRAVEYIGAFLAGRDDFKIHLFHALKPLPPQLMESPGSEDPSVEQQIERRQAVQQENWRNRAETQLVPVLEAAKSQNIAANIPDERIATHILQLNGRANLVSEITTAAREYRCETVVVGYNDYPWLTEKFHTHIAEQMIVQCERLAVCVVK